MEFPSGTSISTNDANVSLAGSGATIAALVGLNANGGSFSLSDGASFTTTGDLSNSGSLTVGSGSTLTVAGNFAQTATATLNDQYGGTSGSGQFGELSVQDAATLAGTFTISFANGFTPTKNVIYPVMSFASASGAFATVTGLGSSFTEQLNPTALNVVSGTGTPVNLQLSQVTAPTMATTGQQITVNWRVSNTGSTAATGNWQDSIYLSTTPTITGNSILLAARRTAAAWLPAVPTMPARPRPCRRLRRAIITSWCKPTASSKYSS